MGLPPCHMIECQMSKVMTRCLFLHVRCRFIIARLRVEKRRDLRLRRSTCFSKESITDLGFTKQEHYFWVNFDHFRIERHFLRQLGVNFMNIKRANFSYEMPFRQLFSSYMYVKKQRLYEKVVRLTLMKLTIGLLWNFLKPETKPSCPNMWNTL